MRGWCRRIWIVVVVARRRHAVFGFEGEEVGSGVVGEGGNGEFRSGRWWWWHRRWVMDLRGSLWREERTWVEEGVGGEGGLKGKGVTGEAAEREMAWQVLHNPLPCRFRLNHASVQVKKKNYGDKEYIFSSIYFRLTTCMSNQKVYQCPRPHPQPNLLFTLWSYIVNENTKYHSSSLFLVLVLDNFTN